MRRLPYTAEGLAAFAERVLRVQFTGPRCVPGFVARLRLGAFLVANLALIMRCVAGEAKRLRAMPRPPAVDADGFPVADLARMEGRRR